MSTILNQLINKELNGFKKSIDFLEMNSAKLIEGEDYETISVCGKTINFAYAINTGEIACAIKVGNENWVLFSGEADFESVMSNPEMKRMIEFLFYHEIGHIIYDHVSNMSNDEHRIDYTLEAQADAYACYVLGINIDKYKEMEENYSFGCTPESIEVVKTEVEKIKKNW